MDNIQKSGLADLIPGGIVFDYPMNRMTAFNVGGMAEAVCFPGELTVLCRLISYMIGADIPYIVVGKGSNLLVRDEGFKGAVIVLKGNLASVEETDPEAHLIHGGGGITIAGLLSYCKKNSLSGLEFLSGIPGTLGGAVYMNAGAWGQEIGNLIHDVLIVGEDGKPDVINREDMKFSYRSSSLPGGAVIYGARLGLRRGDRERIAGDMAKNLKRKKETQPLDYPSAGSIFKNPPNDYAGRLIEKAGLKGARMGGAMISPIHANFIVNRGGAKASDILGLISLARARVREETGIDLETEIVIMDD